MLVEELVFVGDDFDFDYGYSGSENGDEFVIDMVGEVSEEEVS